MMGLPGRTLMDSHPILCLQRSEFIGQYVTRHGGVDIRTVGPSTFRSPHSIPFCNVSVVLLMNMLCRNWPMKQ